MVTEYNYNWDVTCKAIKSINKICQKLYTVSVHVDEINSVDRTPKPGTFY